MKKTLLAVAVGALAVVSTANANWYVQGDLGMSKIKVHANEDGVSKSKTVFEPRLSAGYDFDGLRVAADYTHYGTYKDYDNDSQFTLKAKGLGLTAFYDFDLSLPVKPYVGARLAFNHISFQDVDANGSEKESSVKLGYGLLVGAQYKLTNSLYLNGGLDWNRLGTYSDGKVDQYGAKVGIRFDF